VFTPGPAATPPDFLAEYTRPGVQVADLAPVGYPGGLTGVPRKHPGKLANGIVINRMSSDQGFFGLAAPIGPLPTLVADPDSPYGAGRTGVVSHTPAPAPTAGPAGALIFDSFARPNQNFVLQSVPSLGMTESGSLGPLVWNVATIGAPIMAAPFGLMSGRAVFLERQPGLAWVDAGTTEQDVRVERLRIGLEYGTAGAAFRVVDAKNWSYAFVDQEQSATGAPAPVQVGAFVNGVLGPVTSIASPNEDWSFLRVVAQTSTVDLYVSTHGGNDWTKIGTVANQRATAAATGAGLIGAPTAEQATSLWRVDTFTVCPLGTCQ
jgi:hypothetical protein